MRLPKGLRLQAWPLFQLRPFLLFNIEVYHTCQMPFWQSKSFCFNFRGGTSQKCTLQTFHWSQRRPVKKNACHKIQWVQFVNKNIVGLQSWHFGRHFQKYSNNYCNFRFCNFNSSQTATLAWQTQLYVNVDFPNRVG